MRTGVSQLLETMREHLNEADQEPESLDLQAMHGAMDRVNAMLPTNLQRR